MKKTLKNVSLQTLEGKTITTKSMISNEVTVLSLWSTKCAPCKKKLNAINKVYESWRSDTGVKFYAVSIDKPSDNSKIRNYLPDFKFTPIEEGIKETVKWFEENYNNIRK